jgi:hypothetical protein
MPTITKPEAGQDVRELHRSVRELIDGINSIANMTALIKGRVSGVGRLAVRNGASELMIRTGDGALTSGTSRRAPTIILTSSHNPSHLGDAIFFTATIPGAVGGTVVFERDGVPIGAWDVINQVALTPAMSFLGVGVHSITAHFTGDTVFLPGDQLMLQEVDALPIPLMDIVSVKNPAELEDTIDFGATLASNTPTPTGNVRFFIDGGLFSTNALRADGTAVSNIISTLTAGRHEVEADYEGDSNWGQANATLIQVIKQAVTCRLVIDPNPVDADTPYTVYADVSGYFGTATGQIRFNVDGVFGGWLNLAGGSFTGSVSQGSAAGDHPWYFEYSGDSVYGSDTSNTVIEHVNAVVPVATVIMPAVWQVSGTGILGYVNPAAGYAWRIDIGVTNYPEGFVQLGIYSPGFFYGGYQMTCAGGVFGNAVTLQIQGGSPAQAWWYGSGTGQDGFLWHPFNVINGVCNLVCYSVGAPIDSFDECTAVAPIYLALADNQGRAIPLAGGGTFMFATLILAPPWTDDFP